MAVVQFEQKNTGQNEKHAEAQSEYDNGVLTSLFRSNFSKRQRPASVLQQCRLKRRKSPVCDILRKYLSISWFSFLPRTLFGFNGKNVRCYRETPK